MKEFCIEHGLIEPIATHDSVSDDTYSDTPSDDLKGQQTQARPIAEPVTVEQGDLFSDTPKTIVYRSRRAGAGRKAGRKYDHEKQLTFAPLLELLYQQAIERANRPKPTRYRRITDTDYSRLNLLITFDGAEFAKLTESYDYLSVLNRIRDDYRAGRFNAKPHSYYAQHPRPS